jgi:hypothetical protein
MSFYEFALVFICFYPVFAPTKIKNGKSFELAVLIAARVLLFNIFLYQSLDICADTSIISSCGFFQCLVSFGGQKNCSGRSDVFHICFWD